MNTILNEFDSSLATARDPLKQLQRLLIPTPQKLMTMASPSQKLLCALGDWTQMNTENVTPVSLNGWMLLGNGYKMFTQDFKGGEHAMITLRTSTSNVVELQSLIAYPDSRGNGTTMMKKLCSIADELAVDIWLEALPFGSDRLKIPLKKLKSYYRGFKFGSITAPHPQWLCKNHAGARFKNVMLRRAGK